MRYRYIVLAVLLFALVACGGSDDENDEGSSDESNRGMTVPRHLVDPTVYDGIPLDANSPADRTIERADDVAPGVARGLTEEGIPYIGSLDAPVVVINFSDFSCNHCATFDEDAVERLIQNYVRNGQVRFEFYPVTLRSFGQPSVIAARSAVCAAQQGAFWEFYSGLFEIRRREGHQAFERERVAALARELGLDDAALLTCMDTPDAYRQTLATSGNLQNTLAIRGTPSVFYRAGEGDWQQVPASYDAIESGITPYLN